MDSHESPRMEMLNASNYLYWSVRAQGALLAKNCWDTVEKGLPPDPTEAQLTKDAKARGTLLRVIDNHAIGQVRYCKTAKEVWDTLKETRDGCDAYNSMRAFRSLAGVTMEQGESVIHYLTRLDEIVFKIKGAGMPLLDAQIAIIAVTGLTSAYDVFARNLRPNDPEFSLKKFQRALLEEEGKIGGESKTETVKAFATKQGSDKPKKGKKGEKGKGASDINGKRTNEAKAPDQEEISAQWPGAYYGQPRPSFGPSSYRPQGYGQPRPPFGDWGRGRAQMGYTPRYSAPPECFRCKRIGHIGRYCPTHGDHLLYATPAPVTTERPRQEARVAQADDQWQGSKSYMVKRCTLTPTCLQTANENALRYGTRTTPWVWDTGATDHMHYDLTRFRNFVPNTGSVEVADGTHIESTGKGDIYLQLSKTCGGKRAVLRDVLHVPALGGSLLSVTRLADRQFKFQGDDKAFHVFNSDWTYESSAVRQGDLYCMFEEEMDEREGYNTRAIKAYEAKSVTEATLWHRRLGHLNQMVLKEMKPELPKMTTTCDSCAMGKITAKSFPKESQSRSTRPLALVHADLLCVLSPVSQMGYKYIISFVDDYSRFGVVNLAKLKSDAIGCFKDYLEMATTQLGVQLQQFRCDRGGEFKSSEFDNLLRSRGILRQLTIPHTSQQNGVAERKNRTLATVTRCLLVDSGLPVRFWDHAVLCANYVINRRPTKANRDGSTPHQRWWGKAAHIEHLRVFGCRCWFKGKTARPKLSPTGDRGILLGYSNESKAYIIWDEERRVTILARDVVFDESVFPARLIAVDHQSTVAVTGPQFVLIGNDDSEDDFDEPGPTDNDPPTQHDGETDVVDADITAGLRGNTPREKTKLKSIKDVPSTNASDETVPGFTTTRGRHIKPPTWTKDYDMGPRASQARTYSTEQNGDPKCLSEALSSTEHAEWMEAVKEEFDNLIRNEVWSYVRRQRGMRTLRTKWALKRKLDEDGKVARYRARLVAMGNEQRPGIDYTLTYSPVVKARTTRLLFAIAAELGWEVHHVDIVAAYLAADLPDEAYIEIPEGFDEMHHYLRGKYGSIPTAQSLRNDDWVLKLRKCMYGLHQSGRIWNERLDEYLRRRGLRRSVADPCVYYHPTREIIIAIYVDDILIFGTRQEIETEKRNLAKEFQTRDLGKAHHVQAVRIRYENGSVILDQTAYVKDILNMFQMTSCNPAKTPLPIGLKLKKTYEENGVSTNDATDYRTLMGSLQYLVTNTRPDLAFSVSHLSQFNANPSSEHWQAAKHVLRYLKSTENYCLRFQRTGKEIQLFVDADWGSDLTDRKSYSGYVAILAGGAISWSCRKQTVTAQSTLEAEFLALGEATREALWLRNLLNEIYKGEFCGGAIQIMIDNEGAKSIAENHAMSERTKHLDLKTFFVQGVIDEGKIRLTHVPSCHNVADGMTKMLDSSKMIAHQRVYGVSDLGGC